MSKASVLEVPGAPVGPDVPIDPPVEDPSGPAIDIPVEAPSGDPMPPDSAPEIDNPAPGGPEIL
ncbi:MAG: hypothetical protein ACR2KV_01705 [Solirubrobacteraceae bacterium]